VENRKNESTVSNAILQLCLILIVLGVCVFGAQVLMNTGPKAKKRKQKPVKSSFLVETTKIKPQSWTAIVEGIGTVVPARQVELKTRVSGTVQNINKAFYPGGFIKKDSILLNLDTTDIEIEIQKQQARILQAESNIRIEQGQQKYAQTEFSLNKNPLNQSEKDLILRVPQRKIKEAELALAKSQMTKLKTDLSRAQIKVPFDALVIKQQIDVGTFVNTGTTLATLVDISQFRVRTSIPLTKLKWLLLPKEGTRGSICTLKMSGSSDTSVYEGKMLSLVGDVENNGRMANILIEVNQPHNYPQPLLLNSSVELTLSGKQLNRVFAIPTDFVHNDNQIWVYEKGKLVIRNLNIVFRERHRVIVKEGIDESDLLITSRIPAPVNGMKLRTQTSDKN
jgi:RND family efflux transporter MFP subunit